jgi:hypothetical protein
MFCSFKTIFFYSKQNNMASTKPDPKGGNKSQTATFEIDLTQAGVLKNKVTALFKKHCNVNWADVKIAKAKPIRLYVKFSKRAIDLRQNEKFKLKFDNATIEKKNEVTISLTKKNVEIIEKLYLELNPPKKDTTKVEQPKALPVVKVEVTPHVPQTDVFVADFSKKLVTDLQTNFSIQASVKFCTGDQIVLSFQTAEDATKAKHLINLITLCDHGQSDTELEILVDSEDEKTKEYLEKNTLSAYIPAVPKDIDGIVALVLRQNSTYKLMASGNKDHILLFVGEADYKTVGKDLFSKNLYVGYNGEGCLFIDKTKTASELTEKLHDETRRKVNEALKVAHVFDRQSQAGTTSDYSYVRQGFAPGLRLNCMNGDTVMMIVTTLNRLNIRTEVVEPKKKTANFHSGVKIFFPQPWEEIDLANTSYAKASPFAEFFKTGNTLDMLGMLIKVWLDKPEFVALVLTYIREHNPELLINADADTKIASLEKKLGELTDKNKKLETDAVYKDLYTRLVQDLETACKSDKGFDVPSMGKVIPISILPVVKQ